jgi:hypothetical protein
MLDANAASADGKLAFRVNGLLTETDSFRDGREGKMRAVNPTLAWRPTRARASRPASSTCRATSFPTAASRS